MHLQGAQPVLFHPLKRFGAVASPAPEYLCSLTEARAALARNAQSGALAGVEENVQAIDKALFCDERIQVVPAAIPSESPVILVRIQSRYF
jgi:hypothetical protein